MAKQVFDLHAGKGMSAGQSTEHLRNYKVVDPDYKKYGYYDPTRVNLNFEVGRGGVIKPVNKHYSIVQRFKDNLRNRGIEDPNEIKRKKGLEPNLTRWRILFSEAHATRCTNSHSVTSRLTLPKVPTTDMSSDTLK